MIETATSHETPLTLTESELSLIVSWWSWTYGAGATNEQDDALAARLAAKASEHASR